MPRFELNEIKTINRAFAKLLNDAAKLEDLMQCLKQIIPFDAVFSCINQNGAAPQYVYDDYQGQKAQKAVKLYLSTTYLLNPVYNAFLDGLKGGIHRMKDLAPDHWQLDLDHSDIHAESDEEIGYRTHGWPSGLQELVISFEMDDGKLGEISLARADQKGGFDDDMIAKLQAFYPLIELSFKKIYETNIDQEANLISHKANLEDFAQDILTSREAQVVQLILKGHSSLSIGLNLDIALPTVKSHRKNAYAKLNISSQQELFNLFLAWVLEQ